MSEPLESGTTLWSRYRIQALVAQGGQGSIYQAEDIRLEGRLCAIKEVAFDSNISSEQQEQIQEQFQREASILARLDHPNLPKVSDFFFYNGFDYLVMDYVPGRDLREIIEEARVEQKFIPEEKVLAWAEEILDALIYLHSQEPPILHRDIKPANIKLLPSGPIKLVDFGLVKVMMPEDNRTITILQGKGTVQYTPLEQYGDDVGHTDGRSDIYSLGATLFHLLTLQPAPDAKERYLYQDRSLALNEINPTISPRTARAILHAMQIHPNERPDNVHIFKKELLGQRTTLPISFDTYPWKFNLDLILAKHKVLLAIISAFLLLALIITTFSPTFPAT